MSAPTTSSTTTSTRTSVPPSGRTRLLLDGTGADHRAHTRRYGELPRPRLDELLSTVADSGLTGRGGGGFPTATKVRAVAAGARRPVVVGNAMEGEPLSSKDAVLLTRNPHLVLDGLEIVARALGSRRVILAVGRDLDAGTVESAAHARRIQVARLDGGFVAGQETALVNQLDGRPAVPRDPFTRVTESGVQGRPTLVLNAETLAQLALLVRYGGTWFRSCGTEGAPGTSLFTISGAVRRPGVVEAAGGSRLVDVLAPAEPERPAAVLVGGYHGAWVPASHLGLPLRRIELAAYRANVGAGVLHVLDDATCPVAFAADVAEYLAGESTRQCGPCLNGLPHLAANLKRLAAGVRDRSLPAEIARMSALVTGRGACAHPDGSARFVASTLEVFRGHVATHLDGWCPSAQRRAAS
jgi:NADH:ubiquinone oxidoreductase subunit F (NADH-binding)